MFANRFVTVLMLLLLTAGFGLAYKGYDVTWSDEGVLVLTFQLGDFQIEPVVADGRVYSQLAFAGNVWTRRAGFAELPVLSASVQLPAYGDYTLEILDADEEYVPLSHPMLPSRGVIYRNQNPDLIPYWVDPQSLAFKIYPEQPARLGEPFIYRDVRGATVFASPFQYMAREGLLKVSHTLRVALMPKAAQISTNPIAYPHQGLTSEMQGDSSPWDTKLNGVGTFTPSIDRSGTLNINVRPDVALKSGINNHGGYRGTVLNKNRAGLSNAELKELWDAEHPDDPLNIPQAAE